MEPVPWKPWIRPDCELDYWEARAEFERRPRPVFAADRALKASFGWTLLSKEALKRAETQLREDVEGVRDEIGFLALLPGFVPRSSCPGFTGDLSSAESAGESMMCSS
jgi:hypothetical protein